MNKLKNIFIDNGYMLIILVSSFIILFFAIKWDVKIQLGFIIFQLALIYWKLTELKR